jgi:hypothetical protein
VNKRFYATTQLVAHRRKTLYYENDMLENTQKQIQAWLDNPLLLRNIRELTLSGHLYSIDLDPDNPLDRTPIWAPLIKLVEKAARLIKVNMDVASEKFPLALLQALETCHPQVKLCIWNYYRPAELGQNDAAEKALTVSPILHAIKVNVRTNRDMAPVDLRTAAFKRIVANAPNLEIASICRSSCRGEWQSPEDAEYEQRAAAKFYSNSRGPNTSVRKLVLDGFSLTKDTLMDWGKYVSLPHLEDLKFSRGFPERTYFEAAPALLTNLKHLSLNLSSASRHPKIAPLAEGYLANTCAPLETLSLWSWKGVVSIDAILKHAPTLKRLELHERESSSTHQRRGLLSIEDVRRIRKECPQLESLTLDMDREAADWRKDLDHHKEMLLEVARFGKRLQRVQIYLDLGVAKKAESIFDPHGTFFPGQDVDDSGTEGEGLGGNDAPAVSVEHVYEGPFYPPPCGEKQKHAKQAWKIIFGDPTNTGARELEIKWGEWERKAGSEFHWSAWEHDSKRRVVVRPDERDDRPGQATVQIFGGHCDDD